MSLDFESLSFIYCCLILNLLGLLVGTGGMSILKTDAGFIWVAVSILSLVVCVGVFQVYTFKQSSCELYLEQLYQKAVEDAMVTEACEVCCGLTPIVESNENLIWQGEAGNKSVLVVTLTKYASSYPAGEVVNTTWGETWVTPVPEIKMFFQNNVDRSSNLTLRALQLLGLPPNSSSAYFVEFWVQPQVLFRPTPDNEVTDSVAQLDFPDSATVEYKNWFNENMFYSYQTERFPWTRLGYTYDWGSSDAHVGLSEYVVKAGSLVRVESVSAIEDYLCGD